ncbi:sugar epimerase [Candidatus Parcubacteria bacterium]|nr:MAG: sugar epimerase [Candidatus Parcubacteria bacterium]
MNEPKLMQGGVGIDDRGEVGFVNEFNFSGVKRFYTVKNYRRGFIRAWHAHRREAKYVTVVKGTAIVGAVKIDNWENPSKELKIHRYVLSAGKPSMLFIPNNYANGFMNLTDDTILVFYSSSTLEESQGDDTRYDAHYWNPWEIIER